MRFNKQQTERISRLRPNNIRVYLENNKWELYREYPDLGMSIWVKGSSTGRLLDNPDQYADYTEVTARLLTAISDTDHIPVDDLLSLLEFGNGKRFIYTSNCSNAKNMMKGDYSSQCGSITRFHGRGGIRRGGRSSIRLSMPTSVYVHGGLVRAATSSQFESNVNVGYRKSSKKHSNGYATCLNARLPTHLTQKNQ
jgi:hypothetical protein